jgi:hypothetical protein
MMHMALYEAAFQQYFSCWWCNMSNAAKYRSDLVIETRSGRGGGVRGWGWGWGWIGDEASLSLPSWQQQQLAFPSKWDSLSALLVCRIIWLECACVGLSNADLWPRSGAGWGQGQCHISPALLLRDTHWVSILAINYSTFITSCS